MEQSNLTIQVQIGNRSYPLTVPAEEQADVLQAAANINKGLKDFEQKYKVKDQQDLLAMFSLQLATEQLKTSVDESEANKELSNGLQELNQLVTDYLDRQ